MPADLPRRLRARLPGLVFVGLLSLLALGGLRWALNPEPLGQGVTLGAEAEAEADDADAAAGEGDGADEPGAAGGPEDAGEPEPTPEPEPEPTPTGPPPEELIAAAPPPGQTSVQVLEAGGGAAGVSAVAEVLRDFGYQVVSTTSARIDVPRTTVWFTEGNEAAGQALRARDPRFAEVTPNNGLNPSVDLHVLVGPGFTD